MSSADLETGPSPVGGEPALALSTWIGQQTVTCDAAKKDRYRRWLARCAVAGQYMGEWLASSGWAAPYRDCKCDMIRDAAHNARAAQIGIWTSAFTLPWEWGKSH
jgi:endonuclease YncB( thermonuclease family)